jgi:4-amino-4-deoxy-L-arabinose transferase-like glycosyltransferase
LTSAPAAGVEDGAREAGAVSIGGALFAVLLALQAVALIGVGVYFVRQGEANLDEGWYLYAARLVYNGEVPYRDFAFFQPPAVPYIYGLFQQLFGPGIEAGRYTSLLFSAGTVLLGARLSSERGGRLGVAVFMFGILLTPIVLWSFTTTRSEPLNAFFAMTAAFLLLRERPSGWASAGAIVAALLAAATRITAAAFAVVVIAWVIQRHRRHPLQLGLVLVPGLVVFALFVVLLVAVGWDAAWFNIITSQAERHEQLAAEPSWSAADYLRIRSSDIVELNRWFGFVPLLSFAALAVLAAVLYSERRQGRVSPEVALAGGLALLAVALYAPNLLPRAVLPGYFVPAFPLLLVLLAWAAGRAQRTISSPEARRVALGVLAGMLVLQGLTFSGQFAEYTDASGEDLEDLRTVAAFLQEHVPPGGVIVTMDVYIAVEADRDLPRGWEMSIFSYFPRRPDSDAGRYHILTTTEITRVLTDGSAGAVLLSDRALGVLLERRVSGYRPFEVLSEDELQQAFPLLRLYRLETVFGEFGQFRDPLYLFLPTTSPGLNLGGSQGPGLPGEARLIDGNWVAP